LNDTLFHEEFGLSNEAFPPSHERFTCTLFVREKVRTVCEKALLGGEKARSAGYKSRCVSKKKLFIVGKVVRKKEWFWWCLFLVFGFKVM